MSPIASGTAAGYGRPRGRAGPSVARDGPRVARRPHAGARRRCSSAPSSRRSCCADAFVAAHRTVGWVVACSVVALLIDPLVDVRRPAPAALAGRHRRAARRARRRRRARDRARQRPRSTRSTSSRRARPRRRAELEERYDWAGRDRASPTGSQDFVDDLDTRVRKDAVSQAAGTAPTYVVTGILMLFLLAVRPALLRRASPTSSATTAGDAHPRRSATAAAPRGRRYLLVAIGQSIVNGVVVGLVCWAPRPAGGRQPRLRRRACSPILPLIGVLVGGIPALLLAFGLEGWQTALWCCVVLLVLQAVRGGASCGRSSTPAPCASARRSRSSSACSASSSTASVARSTASRWPSSAWPRSTASGGAAATDVAGADA